MQNEALILNKVEIPVGEKTSIEVSEVPEKNGVKLSIQTDDQNVFVVLDSVQWGALCDLRYRLEAKSGKDVKKGICIESLKHIDVSPSEEVELEKALQVKQEGETEV
jgi:hypothetical protein